MSGAPLFLVPDPSRKAEKTAVRKAMASPDAPPTYPEVLRVLRDDETRSYAFGLYRAGRHKPDDFERGRGAREGMADALSLAEDRLELRGPKAQSARESIRGVRRRLEQELWP